MKLKLFAGLLLAAMLFTGCGGTEAESDPETGLKYNQESQSGEPLEAGEESKPGTSLEGGEESKPGESLESGEESKPQASLESGAESKTGESLESGGESSPESEARARAETIPEAAAEYIHESASGKVKFDCKIEIPDSLTENRVPKLIVTGRSYGDQEKIFARYVEGKVIADTYENEAHDGIPTEKNYMMTDESGVNMGNDFYYWSENSRFYNNAGVTNTDYWPQYKQDQVLFPSASEAIEGVLLELDRIGFSEFTFQLAAYPVNHKTMQQLEQEVAAQEKASIESLKESVGEAQVEEEGWTELEVKEAWTEEDDAYVVYGYQVQESLPIYHQWMAMFRSIAYDNVTNASLVAVYSSRGVEQLMVNPVYYFENTGETRELKEFEEIAGVVEQKFENLLNDTKYVVQRARLFQMVRLDQSQEESVLPVWYFEVEEGEDGRKVTLVDAETGKLIF